MRKRYNRRRTNKCARNRLKSQSGIVLENTSFLKQLRVKDFGHGDLNLFMTCIVP